VRKPTRPATTALIKTLTGGDLDAARRFLLKKGFAPAQGFWSQYAGRGKISCATTAICVYALAETGPLTIRQRQDFQRVLLAFRRTDAPELVGAFPRTSGEAVNVWTTGQASLALLAVGAPWELIKPSVEWLLRTQSTNGGWNYPGTAEGRERLIYTFYPTLVLLRCRAKLRQRARNALSRVAQFLESCEEQHDPFWIPLRLHLRRLIGGHPRDNVPLLAYAELFEDRWPTVRVDENWLPDRFSMALNCGANYLHLRHTVAADDPLALLHVRYLADERVQSGWNDERDQEPKTWATALGALTLHRWARDVARVRPAVKRLPTRLELFSRVGQEAQAAPVASKMARALIRRFLQVSLGPKDARAYQDLIVDVFTFLFGDSLREPKPESGTRLGTFRRDVTFRNAADAGPWADWKSRHLNESVLIECKNQKQLEYRDVRQASCYLGKTMGRLGILASRKSTPDDLREILTWFVNNDEKYILVVNDETLTDWIRLKDRGGDATAAIADVYRSLREGVQ